MHTAATYTPHMEEWQRRIIGRIADEIDEYQSGRRSLLRLVVNVEGLYQAAEIKDREIGDEFHRLWLAVETERELQTDELLEGTWTDDVLVDAVRKLRAWAVSFRRDDSQS